MTSLYVFPGQTCQCYETTEGDLQFFLCGCRKSWVEARDYCRLAHGANLAQPFNASLQTLLAGRLKANTFGDTWIGGMGSRTEWHWAVCEYDRELLYTPLVRSPQFILGRVCKMPSTNIRQLEFMFYILPTVVQHSDCLAVQYDESHSKLLVVVVVVLARQQYFGHLHT